jgi:hypothetical protein
VSTDPYHRWCILRTSGGNTLPVARSLTAAGFGIWTPVETQKRQKPRSRVMTEITLPIIPGIIFARDDRLHELVTMARAPALTYLAWNPDRKRMERHGCPHFSVFRYQGKYPRIADRYLDPLRQAEQRGRPRSIVPALNRGDTVRHPSNMLGGLIGIVQKTKGRYAAVLFGSLEMDIEMCDLMPVERPA